MADALSRKVKLADIYYPLWHSRSNQVWHATRFGSKKIDVVSCPRQNKVLLGRIWPLNHYRSEGLFPSLGLSCAESLRKAMKHRGLSIQGRDKQGPLFLVTHMRWHRVLCANLSCVPTQQGGVKAIGRTTRATSCGRTTIEERYHGLHYLLTQVWRVWNDNGRDR